MAKVCPEGGEGFHRVLRALLVVILGLAGPQVGPQKHFCGQLRKGHPERKPLCVDHVATPISSLRRKAHWAK